MKYLITGGAGFIGINLVEKLAKNKNNYIYIIDNLSKKINKNDLLRILRKKNVKLIQKDLNKISSFLKNYNFDYIYHFAAILGVHRVIDKPYDTLRENISTTISLINFAKKQKKLKKICFTSTSEVYGSALYVPMDEKHPMQPQSPYSASKIAADAIAMSFYYSFNLPVTILRPFNTYGPRQSARAIIPSIIIQIANNIKEISLGDTSTTRDFNYVEDTCMAFLSVANNDNTIGKTLNAGSNSEISIHNLFLLIKNIMKSNTLYKTRPERLRPLNSEVQRLYSDSNLLKNITGFEQKISLNTGLIKTIEW